MAATMTMAGGSINSTVVFGTRAWTAFVTRSTSAASASFFAAPAPGTWHQAFMSSSGSCSSMATRSLQHSFSRSFFLGLLREATATKPKSSLPFFPVFASMRTVTLDMLAILRGGSMPSSQRAIQPGWICSQWMMRFFGSLALLLPASSSGSRSSFLLRCLPLPLPFSPRSPLPRSPSPPLLSPLPRRSPRLGELPRPGAPYPGGGAP
mmetsp:Transcript_35629/g.105834  ORF Transcript_35629/g.105834 Transcript_35629/m.105834 type:complete len:208 (-) Transcript_35629:22-645(-)